MVTETAADLATLRRFRAVVRSGTAKSIRVGAGHTIEEMARAANASSRSIQRWERQQTVPHGPAAIRYGQLLDSLLRDAQ